MVEREIVNEILSIDTDIAIISEEDGISYFELFGSEYGIQYFPKEDRTRFPKIVVRNYNKYDYPHIMTYENKINGDVCRSICLYEDEKFIKYLYSYEEKICETIERLKSLLQLTEREIEEEFQKEFLYYWNKEAKVSVDAYLEQERSFQKLNLYQNKLEENNMRFVSSGIKLNDDDSYKHIPNVEGFYIPLTDNRRIVPPVKGNPWTMKEIMNIIDGRPYSRICRNTFDKILSEKSKATKVLLIFEMIINGQNYNFGILVEFSNQTKAFFWDRLKDSVKKITLCIVNRCDYYFLNKQIGNDTSLNGKKIAVVGCGSLGSYIADDLVKAGIKNVSLYDSDKLSYSNVLRHKAAFNWEGYRKVACIKSRLESIHPEIFVEINSDLTSVKLKEDMYKYDLIIFTVGSSDVQLSSNQVFMEEKYDNPVVYVWLEAGGTDSHILTVGYSKKGCFECLFTNNSGHLTNNKANKLSEEASESFALSNGCGATRVAYGTSILLRTTSALLDTIEKLFSESISENSLIDITATKVTNNGNSFSEGKCGCCGNRNKE